MSNRQRKQLRKKLHRVRLVLRDAVSALGELTKGQRADLILDNCADVESPKEARRLNVLAQVHYRDTRKQYQERTTPGLPFFLGA